jgi:hypothetical protein
MSTAELPDKEKQGMWIRKVPLQTRRNQSIYRTIIKLTGKGLRNKYHWVVEWSTNLDKSGNQVDHFSVFVGQLNSAQVTEENIRERFSKYGEISTLTLIKKPTQLGTIVIVY